MKSAPKVKDWNRYGVHTQSSLKVQKPHLTSLVVGFAQWFDRSLSCFDDYLLFWQCLGHFLLACGLFGLCSCVVLLLD